jgi:hypothetical protein
MVPPQDSTVILSLRLANICSTCASRLRDLDDDHPTAVAWTTRLDMICGRMGGTTFRSYNGEQFTRSSDVVGARAAGEQAALVTLWVGSSTY